MQDSVANMYLFNCYICLCGYCGCSILNIDHLVYPTSLGSLFYYMLVSVMSTISYSTIADVLYMSNQLDFS